MVQQAIADWVADQVVGLNLCPFARPVVDAGTIRCVVSEAESEAALQAQLADELRFLAAADPKQTATTLLIVPRMFLDAVGFLVLNDFQSQVDKMLQRLELEGVIQVPWFHPHFCFAGSDPDDPGNRTNRAPYPVLHLLREDDVADAVARHPDTARVFENNIARLRQLYGWSTPPKR